MNYYSKSIAAATILSLLLPLAVPVYAQEVVDPAPTDVVPATTDAALTTDVTTPDITTPPVPEPALTLVDVVVPASTDASSTSASVQDTISGVSLESANDPTQVGTSTVVTVEATSTPPASEPGPIIVTASSTDATTTPMVPPVVEQTNSPTPVATYNPPAPPPADQPPPPQVVSTLPVSALQPEKEYTLAIGGQSIPTKKKPDWATNDHSKKKPSAEGSDMIIDSGNVSTSPDGGGVLISGSCSSVYWVVLLYRHQDDYNSDPASYIVNRAFPCTDGTYSYGLTDLPPNLENGTYYILVGGEGDTGSWQPITTLTPITISR